MLPDPPHAHGVRGGVDGVPQADAETALRQTARRATGDGRRATGDGRRATGDGRLFTNNEHWTPRHEPTVTITLTTCRPTSE